jgi:predicted Holliday junction resolvase-like endonuclease
MTSYLQLFVIAATTIIIAYVVISLIRGKVTAKQKHFFHKMEDIAQDTSMIELGVLGREVQYQKEREREAREKHRLEEKEKLREIEERRMKSGEAVFPTHADKPGQQRNANPVVQEKETFYPETRPKK